MAIVGHDDTSNKVNDVMSSHKSHEDPLVSKNEQSEESHLVPLSRVIF